MVGQQNDMQFAVRQQTVSIAIEDSFHMHSLTSSPTMLSTSTAPQVPNIPLGNSPLGPLPLGIKAIRPKLAHAVEHCALARYALAQTIHGHHFFFTLKRAHCPWKCLSRDVFSKCHTRCTFDVGHNFQQLGT